MEQTIMTKLLDGQERMNDKLTAISERTVRVEEVVRRHDEVTFPDIQETLTRMESKQNKDILQFNESKEELNDRIKPLEVDFAKRQKTDEKIWDIVWRNIERFALWAGLIIFSWLYTHK